MLRPDSLEAALPLGSSKGHAETTGAPRAVRARRAPHHRVLESEPRPPKGEFEGWEVGEDDLT